MCREEGERTAYSVVASPVASSITGCNSGITMAQVGRALSNGVTLLRSLPPAGGRVKAFVILNYFLGGFVSSCKLIYLSHTK
jgi:hypothetical protein